MEEMFDKEFKDLFEACRPHINEYHVVSVESLLKKEGITPASSEVEAHKEACYHLKAGLVTSLLREIEDLELGEKDKVRVIFRILERFLEERTDPKVFEMFQVD